MVSVSTVPDGAVTDVQVKVLVLPPSIAQLPPVPPLMVTVPNLSCAVPEIGVVHTAFSATVAVTLCAALMVSVHVPVPLQPPPLQPVKVDPAMGDAASTTEVPEPKVAEQLEPQLMPVGELATAPLPVTALVTVKL